MNENENEIEETGGGDSRRSMMKKLGVGAAIVWSAPVVSTAMTAAGAQSPAPGCPFDDNADNCSGQTICDPDGNGRCFCNRNVTGGVPNGQTYCTVPTNCANQDCQSDADCPAGTVCQATCCGSTKCFVLCPEQGPAFAAGKKLASAPA